MLAKEQIQEQSSESHRYTLLIRSFIATLSLYLVIQFGIFSAYALSFGFFKTYALPFLVVSVAFHGLIMAMLVVFRGDFVIEPSGQKLDHVNKANAITLFRVSTLPTILYIIIASKDYPIRFQLVALVAIIFATDFLDGYVSRKEKQVTRVGRMMDSASDYALLFVITFVFYYFHIIPAWFLWLLVARLVGQGLMVLAVLTVKKRVTPRTSFLGKATVASTMVLYAIELLRYLADLPRWLFGGLEYAVGVIITVSIVDKILIMINDLKAPGPTADTSGRLNSTMDGDNNGNDQERSRDSTGTDQGPQG
jgi:phosphatidylglycerophosphate synthase